MPLIENPTAARLKRVLEYHNKRHDVIASNVANANTPGYRAFDLVLKKELDGGRPLEPSRNDPRHLSLNAELTRIPAKLEQSDAPGRLDGNNVSLEQEFLRMVENRTRYEAGMELLDRWGALNRIAREVR
jgi:flagellar basal-body rod protein FlgB